MPENLFFGTTIPACLLVFKKNRINEDVIFIDASAEDRYEKDKTQNKLTPKSIKEILETYKKRGSIEKFCHVATKEEIKANDYNLNIPRYVDTFEEGELIDIEQVKTNIVSIKSKLANVESQLSQYLSDIGLGV